MTYLRQSLTMIMEVKGAKQMEQKFGLGGYVGGTVKTGTKPLTEPFHLQPRAKAPVTALTVVKAPGLVVAR